MTPPLPGLPAQVRRFVPSGAIRSSGQLVVGSASLQAGIFLAGVIVARAEDPGAFGLYSAALALASLAVGGVAAGMPILMLRRSAQSDVDRRTLRRAVLLQLGVSGLAAVATAAVGGVIFGGWRGAAVSGAAALFFTVNHVATLGQCVQSGRRRYRRAAGADVVAGLLFPVTTAAALATGLGIVGALLGAAVACAVSCAVAWTGLPDLDLTAEPTPLRARDGLSFSLLGFVKAGYGRLDVVTLGSVAGRATAGYYAAAYRLLGPFQLVGTAVNTVYFARLSELADDVERWRAVRRRATRTFVALALAGAAVLIVLAPAVIAAFYGERYESSAGAARVLLLSVAPWSLYCLKLSEMASIGYERRATAAVAAGLVVNVVLVATVGRRFGATGAAWAWVASESAMLLVLTALGRRAVDRRGASPVDRTETTGGSPRAEAR